MFDEAAVLLSLLNHDHTDDESDVASGARFGTGVIVRIGFIGFDNLAMLVGRAALIGTPHVNPKFVGYREDSCVPR